MVLSASYFWSTLGLTEVKRVAPRGNISSSRDVHATSTQAPNILYSLVSVELGLSVRFSPLGHRMIMKKSVGVPRRGR